MSIFYCFRNIFIVVIISVIWGGCAGNLQLHKQIYEQKEQIDSLKMIINNFTKEKEIKLIDSHGKELADSMKINLQDQFGVEVNGFPSNVKLAFSLKTRSGLNVRDDIIIETNQLGEGRNFIVWNGLDDYVNLAEEIQNDIEHGITIEVRQKYGSSKQMDAFLPHCLVYTSDQRGLKKNSFVQIRDNTNISLTLEGFPRDSLYTIYLTRRTDWSQNRPIFDIRNLKEIQQVKIDEFKKTVNLWNKDGLYGWANGNLCGGFNVIIATGNESIASFDTTRCRVFNSWSSLFVVQKFSNDHRAQNLTRFAEEFIPGGKMDIEVDPKNGEGIQPGYLLKATIYFVFDMNWTDGMKISKNLVVRSDVIPIRPGCSNINRHTIPAPLIVGKYDIIIDIDNDGIYTKGIDIIDGLNDTGFAVVPDPQPLLATINQKVQSVYKEHPNTFHLEQLKNDLNLKRYKLTPNVDASRFLSNKYRYDKFPEVGEMLDIIANEIIGYLNEYGLKYTIRCVGKFSISDNIEEFEYPMPDDEQEIYYNPPPHSPFKGNLLIIKNKKEGLETLYSLALLRGFYLYRFLLLKGVLPDYDYLGIDYKEDDNLIPYLELEMKIESHISLTR